jgi:predicted ATPase/DNA-binding SARP family transcriptional activator
VKVRLLGPLEVLDGADRPVAIPGGRQRTLLVLLALSAGRVVPADQLIDGLWPWGSPQQPGNALQLVVSKVRRAVGAESIVTRPPGYVLMVPAHDVDALCFERLVRDGRAALAEARTGSALECFEEALGLWRGDALGEFADVPTAVAAAARLAELRASIVEERFDALLAMGRDVDLVADLDAAISAAPFRERLRGQLMVALYRSGRQADALRVFREARRVLAEELGLEPGTELRRLEAAILRQDETLDRPVAGSLAGRVGTPVVTPTNLRPALTSFVGRQGDIAGIAELLDRHRLVTLVGAGGCGKTRLAAEFAAGRLTEFPDGVWFAALDVLTSGDAVAEAVAEAVGLSTADAAGQPGVSDMQERLRMMLATRTALVVLDNCEHVIDAAAGLAVDLLTSAPRLRLLATSREALRVPGETVWRVPPLSIEDAVTLFTERADAATSNLEHSERDRTVVAKLCERVDGMPLAIELTAARTSAFTVHQLAERLDDRFRLLTAGARTALPRHQTLRAVTDWSYDLLFDDERTAFERLAVFAGGCTLQAAEVICSDRQLPPGEVGALIGRLVDKSLVVADGSGRFRLLQTLAEYGRQRLDDRGGDAVRDRHAAHYAGLTELSYVEWRLPGGRAQTWWLACLTIELDNLRAALDWSIARGDGHTAQRLAGSMGWYWWHAGRAVEGHRRLEAALGCPQPTPPGTRARAVTWAAWVALAAGDAQAAARHADEAIDVSEAAADHTSLGLACTLSAQLALIEGRADVAASRLDRGQEAYETGNDPWHNGLAAFLRSWAAMLHGRTEVAERELLAAIGVFRSVGDICTLVSALNEHSRMLQTDGRIEAAEAAAAEARDVSESFGLRGWQSTMATRLGSLALLRGDNELGAEHYRAAVDLAHDLALPHAELAALEGLALAHQHNGDHAMARQSQDAALAIATQLGRSATTGEAPADATSADTIGSARLVATSAGDPDEVGRG